MHEIVLDNPCGPAAFTLSGQLWDWGACKPPLGQIASQEPPSADRDTSTTEHEQTQLFVLNTKSLHVQQALRSFLALLQAEVQHQLSRGGDNMLSRWGCPLGPLTFLLSDTSFLVSMSRITRGPGELLYASVSHLCLWYLSFPHHKAKGLLLESHQQKTKQKQMSGTVQQGISWSSSSLAKNQQSRCQLLTLQSRCNLRI